MKSILLSEKIQKISQKQSPKFDIVDSEKGSFENISNGILCFRKQNPFKCFLKKILGVYPTKAVETAETKLPASTKFP
jgi:hypothetical protein